MKKNFYLNLYIIIYLVLFFIIPITCVDAIIPKIYDIIQLCTISFMLICLFFGKIKSRKIDKFDLAMIIISIVLFGSSCIKHTIDYKVAFSIITLFTIPVFLKETFKKSINPIQALYYLYVIIIILNIITSFNKMKIGYQYQTFIGGKNSISLTVIPAMLIIHMYSLLKYNKVTKFNGILLIICVSSLLLSNSSTAIVIAILIILYFLTSVKKIHLSLRKIIIIYMLIFVLIVFGNAILEKTFLNTIVEQIFNKNLTFTSRTKLWDISWEHFLKSPIIGYGKNNTIIYNNTGGALDQSHNMILQLLLAGGICSLFSLFFIIYISFNKLNSKNKIGRILLFYFFVYIINGLTESIIFVNQLWMFFAIAYSIKEISNNFKKLNVNEENYDKKNIEKNI